MYQKNGKSLFKLSALALAIAGTAFVAGCSDDDNDSSTQASAFDSDNQKLTRLATVPLGSEVTGLFLSEEGDLFFNVQHPSDSNMTEDADGNVFSAAAVGVIRSADFAASDLGFNELSMPATAEEKELVRTAIGSYDVLAQNGDAWAGAPTGGMGAINTLDGTATIKVSNDPDFNAFISTGAGEGYLFTNWEDRPGGMSRMKIRKDDNGNWNVVDNDVMMIDFGTVAGTWVNCFGTLSPWGNPLTSEELYFDATADWNNSNYNYISDVEALETYLGEYPNPYNYGYIVEITEPTAATPVPVKMRALGRFSHENAVVMPDEKTVYLSDDGTGTVFFKFIADTAGDLTSGTLYAAKATQDGSNDPAVAGFDLEWVELASGDNATIESWVAEYDGIDQTDFVDGSTSYISDAEINNWAEGKLNQDLDGDGTVEDDTFGDDRVAFLESRKAAAALGATAEFRKMEGVNINLEGAADGSVPFAYMAMANFNATMGDDQGDILLDATNGDCGVVYQMPLSPTFDITRMVPAIVGGPYDENATVNNCSADNISEPDNVLVLRDGRVLIGEDTGEHENNMLWLFDPEA
ncbi:cell surface protein [Marinobacter salinus]|uniref:Cell surface protein n=1 Tax=Marinobacter salinus TaxID=1874317 RepID=A0A1D9GHJ5_9GAMM|nr:alkaline phosphatase PhoX [Marinobacter salinus]AOY86975.1 cell surface protein [Marinobacter salinus]